jgi:hypothetical protein
MIRMAVVGTSEEQQALASLFEKTSTPTGGKGRAI